MTALSPKKEGKESKIKLNKRDLSQITEMAEMGLRVRQIAAIMGFTHTTFYRLMERDEPALQAFEAGRAKGTKKAIKHLMSHINEGSEKSLHFYLKFISGYRGVDEFDEWMASRTEAQDKPKLPASFQFKLVESE